jgi:hypothetical protein
MKRNSAPGAPFVFLILFSLFFSVPGMQAQVSVDFENGLPSGFGVEGDGSLSINQNAGNPGNCLQVDEPATGLTNSLILPVSFYGNWSAVGPSDSLFMDWFSFRLSGNPVPTVSYVAEISGPGGLAVFGSGEVPAAFNTWHRRAIPLDSSQWVMATGTWTSLKQSVNKIRLLSEFVAGDEYVRWDNIRLSFSPAALADAEPCSRFEPVDGLDGWNFQNVSSPGSIFTDGLPPNCIRAGAQSGLVPMVSAPPKFLGNWKAAALGAVSFDLKIQTQPGGSASSPYLIRLKGPGGEVHMPHQSSVTDSARNRWYSVELPLDSALWTLVTGTWTGCISNVEEMVLSPGFTGNPGEISYLDNICLKTNPTQVQVLSGEKDLVFPNPASGFISFGMVPDEVFASDATGREVRLPGFGPGRWSTEGLTPGLYQIRTGSVPATRRYRLMVLRR